MGVPSRIPTAIAWVVVALMVAWAPLFHAICIAPTESAGATHVMADGTVMSTPALLSDGGHTAHAAAEEPEALTAAGAAAGGAALVVAAAIAVDDATTIAGPATALLDSAGIIGVVVVVGLAVLSLVVLVRRSHVIPARGHPPRDRPAGLPWRSIRARPSTDVDLHRLGISRT